jgi:UDP-N-acetylglucosamine--N-acetylmuramyl-(pentapeptide) pyrophosphoryl-undecaprenol N-acetylglucosamine transferase
VRLAFTGGGTGGHVAPALAVARLALAQGHQCCYLGTARGIEADMVPREGLPFHALPASGLLRSASPKALLHNLLIPATLLGGVLAARRALKASGSQAVLATGGFVSLPVGLAARSLGLPLVVHESNARPGLANRLLARMARAVCLSYEPSTGLKPGQALTGNPVRLAAGLPPRPAALKAFGLEPDRFTLFVFPGSRAAHSVNQAVEGALPALEASACRMQILWMAGLHDYTHAVRVAKHRSIPVSVQSFIHDTASAYACADLVLARAGASTLAELAVLGLPSVLVPYPFATGRHQDANAAQFAESGAATVLADKDLSGEALAQAVLALAADGRALRRMAAAAKVLGRPDAAERVYAILEGALA